MPGAPTSRDSSTPQAHEACVRHRLAVRGRVQGVGFRPFVYRLATALGLTGHVSNNSQGALIEIQGPRETMELFTARMRKELPPLASISECSLTPMKLITEREFRIEHSTADLRQDAEITPDAATCNDCLRELLDPADRRYRYPFINCTNCGPRYSIIHAVPYDRLNTTMAEFHMCPACQAEYDNPADRRFHAQPNACPACGPRLWLAEPDGSEVAGDAVKQSALRLAAGQIVAVKGIGGFHLVCRADDDAAVERLRSRKCREAKPLAMMVADLGTARATVELDPAATAALTSIERPIVLAPRQPAAAISEHVAPGRDCFGIMLPYTPIHHLLFAEKLGPLVMTSGNPAEEPLCCDNAEGLRRLSQIADAFLLHDRGIRHRVDDSVVMAIAHPKPHVLPIRRARGFAPAAIPLVADAPEPILAVGGELKSTVCVLNGHDALLSEHLGELANAEALRNFMRTVDEFKRLLRVEPHVVAYDMHPDYAATRYARRLGLRTVAVQHHHAHAVSCMADNLITGRVIGIVCDGTGYGTDGEIWGAEVLACDEANFTRFAHLRYFPLLGGDASARETWRPAAGLMFEAFGGDWQGQAPPAFADVSDAALRLAGEKLLSQARTPRASSLGRLFDAVAFVLGICSHNRYEAEAAMALEAAARRHTAPAEPLDYALLPPPTPEAPMELDPRPLIHSLVQGIRSGRYCDELARAFHDTVAAMLAEAAVAAAARTGLTRVVLSGGCFANRLLLERVYDILVDRGLTVFSHCRVPPGDGGLALGQAVVAAEHIRRQSPCA